MRRLTTEELRAYRTALKHMLHHEGMYLEEHRPILWRVEEVYAEVGEEC